MSHDRVIYLSSGTSKNLSFLRLEISGGMTACRLFYKVEGRPEESGIVFDLAKRDDHSHMLALDHDSDPAHEATIQAAIPVLHDRAMTLIAAMAIHRQAEGLLDRLSARL